MSRYRSMNDDSRLKDSLYNISDVIVAIAIIVAAASIIAWRVAVIMSYGETTAENTATAVSLAEKKTEEYNAGKEPGIYNSSMSASGSGETQNNTPDVSGADSAVPASNAENEQQSTGTDDFSAMQNRTDPLLSVTIYDTDTAVTIAERLLQNGIITDAQAFVDSVVILGVDGNLHAGAFTFKPGVTLEEVIDTLSR